MKRGHSIEDITSESRDDHSSPNTGAAGQQKVKKSRKGKMTSEQLDSISDSIDRVISQVSDAENDQHSVSVSCQTEPVSDYATDLRRIDDLASELGSLRQTTECFEHKIDGLIKYLNCIGKFLGLPASICDDRKGADAVVYPDQNQNRNIAETTAETTAVTIGLSNTDSVSLSGDITHTSQEERESRPSIQSDQSKARLGDTKTFKDIVLDAIYRDSNSRAIRAKSVIVSGVMESSEITDREYMEQLFFTVFDYEPAGMYCRRLGSKSDGVIRPILVSLSSSADAAWIIANAARLRRAGDSWIKHNVFINRNLTREERRTAYERRCRIRAQKAAAVQPHYKVTGSGVVRGQGVADTASSSTSAAIDAAQPIRVVVNSRFRDDRGMSKPTVSTVCRAEIHAPPGSTEELSMDIAEFPPLSSPAGATISKVTVSSSIAPPFDISTQHVASVENRSISGDVGRLGDGH